MPPGGPADTAAEPNRRNLTGRAEAPPRVPPVHSVQPSTRMTCMRWVCAHPTPGPQPPLYPSHSVQRSLMLKGKAAEDENWLTQGFYYFRDWHEKTLP